MAKKNLALFEGTWQKVLIKVILLLLTLYVAYRLLKEVFKGKDKSVKAIEDFINKELPNKPPEDGTVNTDPDTISDSEADVVANGLQVAMQGYGTTYSVIGNLDCYNGASLNKIYASFGVRFYNNFYFSAGQDLDLFGWFTNELSTNTLAGGEWRSDCVPNCTSRWDFCSEMGFQREIWQRSSIPVTF